MQRLKIRTKKLLLGVVVGSSVGAVVALLSLARFGITENLELATYDLRAAYSIAPEHASKNILIVDVDEESLQTVAKEMSLTWPWPRELFGVAATYLHDAGAAAVVFDWIFEDEPYGVQDTQNFADALAVSKSVIGLSLSLEPREEPPSPATFAARLATFKTPAEAERAAAFVLTWHSRAFVLPAADHARTDVWVGGTLDESGAADALGRMLGDDVFREAVLKLSPETLPAKDAAPLTRALAVADPAAGRLEGEVTDVDLYKRRNTLGPAEGPAGAFPSRRGVNPPLPLFVVSAGAVGNAAQAVDEDGIFRHLAYAYRVGGALYPGLALAGAMAATANHDLTFPPEGGAFEFLGHRVPLEPDGRTLARFYGARGVYRHISIWDLLQSMSQKMNGEKPKIAPESLKGVIAVVSATARGMKDLKPTPVDPTHLGAEIVATAIDNLLQGDFVRRASPALNAEIGFGMCLLLGVVALYIWFLFRSALLASLLSLLAVAAVVGAYGAVAVYLYGHRGLWLDVALPAVGGAASWAVALLANTYVEGKDRRFVQEALGRYTSKALVQELLRNPQLLSLGAGQKKTMSIYFSDIQGFTTISEGLSPERLVALLNDYLTHLTDIILESGGIVDKYIGDAIMAFWGAPMPMENHAEIACLTALKMRDKIDALRPGWHKEFGVSVVARAGINTGPVVVGNTGSTHKFNYTVLGDTVNLASRLEGANKPYGTVLMISEATFHNAWEKVEVRELDFLAVKGKDVPVKVYELLCPKGQLAPERASAYRLFEQGLVTYRARRFMEAVAIFERVKEQLGEDGPSDTYIHRCETMLKDPPPEGWDGVYHMKEK